MSLDGYAAGPRQSPAGGPAGDHRSGIEQSGIEQSGIELAAAMQRELVGPLLARELPGLRYASARLGSGSDVLGLDDATSRDHDWGCRLTVLVDGADRAAVPAVDAALARLLPQRFGGRPVRFATTWQPAATHQVQVATVGGFAHSRLGVDPLAGVATLDWLTLTGQSVLEVVAGPVFVDTTTELARVRDTLAWYPPQVERYVLASGWQRLTQRMPMIGRTAHTGQALRSRMLCAALAGDVMSLAFLLHRRWQPYDKWREAMFHRLPGASALGDLLSTVVAAGDWRDRETALASAAEQLLELQRRRGLPTPSAGVTGFWSRPYRTVAADVPARLLADLTDPVLTGLPRPVGNVEQWCDSVDVLADPPGRAALAAAYRAWAAAARRPGSD